MYLNIFNQRYSGSLEEVWEENQEGKLLGKALEIDRRVQEGSLGWLRQRQQQTD